MCDISLCRPVRIPDVPTNSLPPNAPFSMVAGDFLEVYGGVIDEGHPVHRPANTQSVPLGSVPPTNKMIEEAIKGDKKDDVSSEKKEGSEKGNSTTSNSKKAGKKEAKPTNLPDNQHKEAWDCVASCYFMDCAHNILQYIEVILFHTFFLLSFTQRTIQLYLF